MLWIPCLASASLFLLLLPGFPGQYGGGNGQSTDIISVWEGDSISITCAMKGSENDLGRYLRTSIQPVNVLYLNNRSIPYIPPALANRVHYSDEGEKFRITLHNVQESDSNIYRCLKYIRNKTYHKKLYGKTTIVVVKANTSGAVEQSPLYVNPQQGQSVSITCALKNSLGREGIYLLRTHVQHGRVLHVSSQNTSTIDPSFANRLEYSKEEKRIVITLQDLQKNDSDVYVCAAEEKNSPFLSMSRSGTMMVIKEVEQTDCSSSSWGVYGLTAMVLLLFSALICCTLYRVNVKKCFQRREQNTVYEDMSYRSRHNTLVRCNTYISHD